MDVQAQQASVVPSTPSVQGASRQSGSWSVVREFGIPWCRWVRVVHPLSSARYRRLLGTRWERCDSAAAHVGRQVLRASIPEEQFLKRSPIVPGRWDHG